MEHFRNAGHRMPAQSNGRMLDWAAIPPDEITLCKRLGVRASELAEQFARRHPALNIVAPHPTICAMDFATVHVHIGLELREWLHTDDLTFTHEYTQLLQGLNRDQLTYTPGAPLKFQKKIAQKRARWFTLPWRSGDRDTKPN